MSFVYLGALVISLAGLAAIDYRARLALFVQPWRTLATVGFAIAFFLLWDAIGIGLGIFFIGPAPYLTGATVAPELPVEEIAFLALLAYQTLLLWLWFSRRRAATEAP